MARPYVSVKYLLRRFDDLKEWLESSADAATASQMINNELMLRFVVAPQIAMHRASMRDAITAKKKPDASDTAFVDSLQKRADGLEKAIAASKTALNIGEDETGGIALKLAISKNVSTLNAAHAAFYGEADSALLDGVFSVAQVEILVRPFGDRRMQYRVDLPLMVAQYREGLWDEKFAPNKLPRTMIRAWRRGMEMGISAALQEDGFAMSDLGDGEDDDEEGMATDAETGAVPITEEDLAVGADGDSRGSGGTMVF